MAVAVWGLGNSKGGVGKSLLAINIAIAAFLAGLRVLLVDADEQGSCLDWGQLRGEREGPDVMEARLERLDEVIGYAEGEGYDLVIIDTAGHDSVPMRAALRHIDVMLVPAQPNIVDLNVTGTIRRAAHEAGVPAPVVLNRVHRETSTRTRWYIERYSADGRILPGAVPERVAMQDAYARGLGVMEYQPDHPAAGNIRSLFSCVRRAYSGELAHAE